MEGEGGGGGMVAVVQGLKDAGLAVTLISDRRRRRSCSTGERSRHVTHTKSSVETSAFAPSANAAAQICDDRYTSSYQMAHCRAMPSSPPVQLTEFPPQRAEPCRTQGNFEIGGPGSIDAYPVLMRRCSPYSMRNNFTSIDRDLLPHPRTTKCVESFAHSLRKYPMFSRAHNSSVSSELVQRLLSYTQAKNFSKSSYHTKSIRSMRNKSSISPKDSIPKTKVSKSVQTYTRAKRKMENAPVSVDGGEKDKDEYVRQKERNSKKFRSRSPYDFTNVREDHIRDTYDYLRSVSRRRISNVQYLTNITRSIRDTLRQICDDRPVVCPSMQSRYSQHRREHHRREVGVDLSSDNMEAQGSSRMISTGVPAMSSCQAIPGTYQQTCPNLPKICCYCRKPTPCGCRRALPSLQIRKFSRSVEETSDFSKNMSCQFNNSTADEFKQNLTDNIMNWLQEIPVYANENCKDKCLRENIAKNLIYKLNDLKGDSNFKEKAKAEIDESVNNMPMWFPGSKTDQDLLKLQITDNLINRLCILPSNLNRSIFEDEISKWINNLDFKQRGSVSSIVDKQELVNSLVEKLKPLALNPPSNKEDFKTAMKSEIKDFLEDIPINIKGDKEKLFDELADSLADKLEDIPVADISKSETTNLMIDNEITKWVEGLNFKRRFSQGQTVDKQNIVNELINKLKPLAKNPPPDKNDFGKALKDEIMKTIEELPIEIDGDRNIGLNKLAENLASKLKKVPVMDPDPKRDITKSDGESRRSSGDLKKEFQKDILDWLEDISGTICTTNLKGDKALVESLANKLNGVQGKGTDSSENLERMQNEINQWLQDNISARRRLDSLTRNKLTDQLVGKLRDKLQQPGKDMPLPSADKSQDRIEQEITGWVSSIPELASGSKAENQNLVGTLAKRIHYLRSQGKSKSELESEMKTFLTNSLKNRGKQIDERKRNSLVNQLLRKISNSPVPKMYDKLTLDILHCFEDVPNFDTSSKENMEVAEQFAKKVKDLQSQTRTDENEQETKDTLINWINEVLENSGTKLNSLAKNKLTQKLLEVVSAQSKPRKQWSKDPQVVINSLREEVGNILDESNVYSENRDEIESVLTDILDDQIVRGDDNNMTQNRIVKALEDMDIPQKQSEDIASRLLNMGKEMSLLCKTKDSSTVHDRRKSDLSPNQNEKLKETAQRDILDFIEEVSGDTNTATRRKRKGGAQKLAEKVGEIMSKRDTAPEEKQALIEHEISEYLETQPIQTDIPIEEQKSLLAERLQNLAFKASTPKRPSLEKELSFRPRRGSDDSTISSIDSISQMTYNQPTSKEEQKYANQLINKINNWIDHLPLNLENTEERGFKNMMVKNLANDIIDRQKYLQLNPDAMTSDEEELEHLKYQVFRWLNKLPNVKNLMPAISKTDNLMELIKAVPVPALAKPEKRPSEVTKDTAVQHVSDSQKMLENEISKWYKAVPLKYKSSIGEKYQRENVKNLTAQIDQLMKDKTLTEEVFEDVISQWLQKMLKNCNERYTDSLIEGLKAVVVNDFNTPEVTIKDTATGIEKKKQSISADGIKAAIYEWAQNLPFQTGKTIKNASKEVQRFVPTVKKVLGNVEPETYEKIQRDLEKEIKTFINTLPVQKTKISDTTVHELRSRFNEIVNDNSPKSQSTQATESMISKTDVKAAEVLYNNIENWCKDLPLPEGNTPEERENDKTLKQNIASKLINVVGDLNLNPEIVRDDTLYEDLVSDEIDDLLSTLPPSPDLENKLPILKHSLIEKVKEAKLKVQNELEEQTHKQQVRNVISKTLPPTDSLPTAEKASFDILKDNLADAYIEFNYAANSDLVKNKLKNKINEGLNKFCNDYLEKYPDSPLDHTKLNKDLFDMLQKIPNPKDEIVKSEVEQLRIKDQIYDWLKEVPLREDETPAEKSQSKKIVNLLAKGLYDIEKEKELNPEINVEDRKQKEINKWIKKLPIRPGTENKINNMVEKLTDKLKDTRDSRRFSISDIKRTADNTENNNLTSVNEEPGYNRRDIIFPNSPKLDKANTSTPLRFLSQHAPQFPPTALSSEDRAHLERIRERNAMKQASLKPISPCFCKDASVSPIPIDAGSQTDMGQQWSGSAKSMLSSGGTYSMPPCSCSPMSVPTAPNQPLSPKVLVKEYYWDPQGQNDSIPQASNHQGTFPQYDQSWPQQQPDHSRFPSPQQSFGPQVFPGDQTGQLYTEPRQSPLTTLQEPPQFPYTSPTQGPIQPVAQSYSQGSTLPSGGIMTPQQPMMSSAYPMPPYMTDQSQRSPQMTDPSFQRQQMQDSSSSPCTVPPCTFSGVQNAQKSSCARQTRPCMPNLSSNTTPESPSWSPKPPCQKRESRPPRFRTPDASSTSPFENECPESSRFFCPRVTRLGSLDDVPCRKPCGSQSPKAKRSKAAPDDSDWTIGFPDDTDFWGSPCPRRRVQRSPLRDGPVIKERERKEEKTRCHCRERVLAKCPDRRPQCPDRRPQCQDEAMKHCPKCCGVHCPHPSYLFFR